MGNLHTNQGVDRQAEDFIVSDTFNNYNANFIKSEDINDLSLCDWHPILSEAKEAAPILHIGRDTFC